MASPLARCLTVKPRRKSFSPKCSRDVTGSPFFIRKQSETESSGDVIPSAATRGAVPSLELPFPHRVGGPPQESGNSPWGEATHPSYRCGNYAEGGNCLRPRGLRIQHSPLWKGHPAGAHQIHFVGPSCAEPQKESHPGGLASSSLVLFLPL